MIIIKLINGGSIVKSILNKLSKTEAFGTVLATATGSPIIP